MATEHWLVLPVLGQIVLTVVIGLLSLRSRIKSLRGRQVTLEQVALDNAAWPDTARKFGNNFDNQFQVPLLFVAAVGFFLATGLADRIAVTIAFLFLVLRLAHAIEHVNANRVPHRFSFYLASLVAMVALWAWFAFRFYVTG